MIKLHAVAAAFAMVLLVSTVIATLGVASFASASYEPWVWHNTGMYIRADGSVDPPAAPIQRSGNNYKLTSDVFWGIGIQRNGSVLDGNGFKMYGNYYGTGVFLQNVSGVTLQNMDIQYFGQGIYLDNVNQSTIKGNMLWNCSINLYQSNGNQITQNTAAGDITVDFSANNTVSRNSASTVSTSWSTNTTITNNNIADNKLQNAPLSRGNYTEGIYVDNSANCAIVGNTVERKNVGIDIWQSTNLTLKTNILSGNQVGFKLWGADLQHNLHTIDTTNTINGKPVYFLVNKTGYQVPTNAGWIAAVNSKNITVQNWAAQPNWDAVLFVESANSKIASSILTGSVNAVRFQNVSDSTVTQNVIQNNQLAAFYFEGAKNCLITDNEVSGNGCLFDFWHGFAGNSIYHNDFFGNQTGSVDVGSGNQWDNGGEGNYWSVFTGVDLDHNGVSDVPCLIDPYSNAIDNYPLMAPFDAKAAPQQQNPQAQTLSMPQEYLNYTITSVNGSLWAQIDGVYPIHLSKAYGEAFPMVYPTPPNTTNLHIWLDGAEQPWSSYNGTATHYTDIGSWQMITCQINPASSDFLLKIHYEHPLQTINGTQTFLYDLNIGSYLSPTSANSVAHFNIQLPQNSPPLNVYRTGYNGTWTPLNYTLTTNGSEQTVTFTTVSEYGKPLLGDIAFVLGNLQVPEISVWILPLLALAVLATAVYVRKTRKC